MNKKIIKLTESDLINIIKKVLNEQSPSADLYIDRIANQKLAQSRLSSTTAKKIAPENINPKNLKFGDRGDDVKILQQKLFDKGLLKTKSMKPTGYFGELTKVALDKALRNLTPKPVTPKKSDDNKNKTNQNNSVSTSNYKYSPRIDAELNYIKQRQGVWNKLTGGNPFFIYDPKFNLIYLFNGDFTLVKSSAVVDGKDLQKDTQPFRHEDWCKAAKLDITPYKCTDPKTKQKKDPGYWVLNNLEVKFIPKGIYSISALGRDEGYVGKGNNVFRLRDSSGKNMSAALHGVPNIEGRLQASKDLVKILNADKNDGKVPQQYLDAVNTVIASANLSYGCVGIPASFIEDPKVIEIVKVGVSVYVMGESEQGYLVQNSGDYFDKIGRDNGMCVNPESVAQSMGRSISGPSKPDYSNIA